jgi:hypothetical protein
MMLEPSLTLLQVVVAACEKFPGKFDVAAKMIKEVSFGKPLENDLKSPQPHLFIGSFSVFL